MYAQILGERYGNSLDKFTIKAQEAVQQANELAGQNGNPEMLPLHLLAALLQDSEGIVAPVLASLA